MEIPNNYLDKFKVYLPDTLFPPYWKALESKRCPLCGCKLYLPRKNKRIVYCSSKKHGKPFVITFTTYNEILKALSTMKVD